MRSFGGIVGYGALSLGMTAGCIFTGSPATAIPSASGEVPTQSSQASASRAPGAIVAAFVGNQVRYCSLICPYIVQGAVEVPAAVVRTPAIFAATYEDTRSFERSMGTAAASVTGPTHWSMTGIIGNDLNLVLPRAQNALEVAVVAGLDVIDAAGSSNDPDRIRQTAESGRTNILDALNAPIVPNPPPLAVPSTPTQVAALEAIDTASVVLFQDPESLLVAVTGTADGLANSLAGTGKVGLVAPR